MASATLDAPVAFRCRNCNTLVEAAHAGQNAVPHACPVCGAGVVWEIHNGVPVKKLDPGNWIVLADLSDEDLAPILEYHAIVKGDIAAHKPADPFVERQPQNIAVDAVEGIGSEDRA